MGNSIQSNALYGEKKHSIDSKGRVIVPILFREKMGEKLVIMRWMEKSILMVTPDDWQKLSATIGAMPNNSEQNRALKRMIFSSVVECVCDKAGRILIPTNLRNLASIFKSVTFVGQGARVEIWATERWQEFTSIKEPDFDKMVGEIQTVF